MKFSIKPYNKMSWKGINSEEDLWREEKRLCKEFGFTVAILKGALYERWKNNERDRIKWST